jgi:nucleoside-diphosphate-sugar epimerase
MKDGNSMLILGARGGVGSEMARQAGAAGWRVVALQRAPAGAAPDTTPIGVSRVLGDALRRDDVLAAAAGVDVIVHAVNPPGYRNWDTEVLPMLDNSIAAARREGATLVLPGTVYNYGPDAFARLDEMAPQNPLTRKGAIRVELERRLLAASEAGCRVLVVRAGDFFGPGGGNNWFSQAMVVPGRVPGVVRLPGVHGVGHQWSYLPDVVCAMLALLARRTSLPPFAAFHLGGHWDADGREMGRAIGRALARHGLAEPSLRPFPWWLIRLAAPFATTPREVLEMRYLWRQPLRMDNRRLLATLGEEPHTPLDEAVEATLAGLGCLTPTRR